MRMNEDDYKKKRVYNEVRGEIEHECSSFGARLLEFTCTDIREEGNLTYFDYYVKIDISGVKKNELESFKPCVEAAFVNIYSIDDHFMRGDIKFDYVGSPKSGGFFSNLFGW